MVCQNRWRAALALAALLLLSSPSDFLYLSQNSDARPLRRTHLLCGAFHAPSLVRAPLSLRKKTSLRERTISRSLSHSLSDSHRALTLSASQRDLTTHTLRPPTETPLTTTSTLSRGLSLSLPLTLSLALSLSAPLRTALASALPLSPSSSPSPSALSPAKSLSLWALLFLLSATLHSAEAAITKISRWKVQELVESEGPHSAFAKLTPQHVSSLLTAMLLATTACSIYSTALYVEALSGAFPSLSLGLVSLSLTLITLFFGEIVPKAIAVTHCERVVRALLPLVQRLAWALRPLTSVINFFSDALLRAVFRRPRAALSSSSSLSPSLSTQGDSSTSTTQPTHTTHTTHITQQGADGGEGGDDDVSEDMLRMVVAEAARSEHIESGEQRMIQNVLDMEDKEVSKIMTPRVDVSAVADCAPLYDVLAVARRTKCSRIPVYHEDIDHVVGVVFTKDLLDFVNTHTQHTQGEENGSGKDTHNKQDWTLSQPERALKTTAKDIAKPVYFMPESMSCWAALQEMKSRRAHMAIVVDEYGGTAGLVTLEDLLEEVVGEIYDEDDDRAEQVEDWTIFKRDARSFVVKAHAELDDVFEALHIDKSRALCGLSKESADAVEECSTIGGLLCALAGCIPRERDVVPFGGFAFSILKVEGQRRLVDILAEPLFVDSESVTQTMDERQDEANALHATHYETERETMFPSTKMLENDVSGTFSNRFQIFRDGEWVSAQTV